MSDLAGKTLLHYEILELLGQGGMGVVYKARDTRLLRAVAIKVLSPLLLVNEKNRQRFMQEAQAASALNHPNICTIYDIGRFNTAHFIVMEYVEGRTLRKVLEEEGPLVEARVIEVSLQVCHALAATHAKGIIHRDIKPDNIMLQPDGIVKIMDFGLAKLAGTSERHMISGKSADKSASEFHSYKTSLSTLEGTARYMAPEQIDKGPVDERTDIYALGVMMYELLTGTPPFDANDAKDDFSLMTAVLHDEPKRPSSLRPGMSVDLETLVLRALSKSPDARPQSMKALSAELNRIASPPPEGKSRRNIWGFAGITTVILLIVVMLFWHNSQSPLVPQFKLKALSLTGVNALFPEFSPDGKQIVYMATTSDDSIDQKLLVRDLNTGQTKTVFEAYLDANGNLQTPTTPDWSPDGRWVVFNFRGGDGICIVDTAGRHLRRITTFGHDPQWSPDGKQIVFASLPAEMISEKSAIWLFNLTDSTLKQVSPESDLHFGTPAWSPSGRWLVCAGGYGSKADLWLIEVETGRAKKILPFENDIPFSRWVGPFIYYSARRRGHGQPALWRVEVDANVGKLVSEPLQVSTGVQFPNFNISEDGKTLIYSRRETSEKLWQIPLVRGAENPWESARLLETHTKGTGNLEVSPDGKALVFETFVWNVRALILYSRLDGSQTLLYDEQSAFAPAWSPDGRWIAFDAGGGNDADIWRIPASGGMAEKIVDHPGADWMPTYSPDGKHICFLSNRGGPFDLWLYSTESGETRQITRTPETESGGYWSHDGGRIAFFRNSVSENRSGIWIYDFASGDEQEVLPFPGIQVDILTKIMWRQDDAALYFAKNTYSGEKSIFIEFILDTHDIRYPLDVAGHDTRDVYYTLYKDQLFLVEREFRSSIWLAEGLVPDP